MKMPLSELEITFKNYLPKQVNAEDNFFGIGSRRFYENPFTEVLAYLLSSDSQYSATNRDKFIEGLFFETTAATAIQSLTQFAKTITQHCTAKGKYIDLIVYNDDYVIVFENKIYADTTNPFEDYEEDVRQKFGTKSARQFIYILMSYKKQNAPKNWEYISIPEKFGYILENYPDQALGKWDYFAKDFLHHFSSKKHKMTDSEKNFYEDNFHKIITARNGLNEYVKNISHEFAVANEITKWQISNNWNNETVAVRFYYLKSNNNIVLIFTPDGRFTVSLYYYLDYNSHVQLIHENIGNEYREWNEGNICCYTLRTKTFNKIEDVLLECKTQYQKMQDYLILMEVPS